MAFSAEICRSDLFAADARADPRNVFERLESEVRSYCRSFPVEFATAKGSHLFDVHGRQYIDLFSGAGSLNYGHNHPEMQKAACEYLAGDGVIHSLDMFTTAKRCFLEKFESIILKPRSMAYKVQFVGPTGATAIEAALKLARLVKKRSNVIAFTNAYHGLSMGALSVTANSFYRNPAFFRGGDSVFMPYDGYLGRDFNTIDILAKYITDTSSGVDLPAAIVVETVQAEGGVNVATETWLKDLGALCRKFDILLVIDDIQVGCGRTGDFFSFEESGIAPDMVALSKSISGFGLPMSILLINPDIDQWKPGEHTGTFRGNNLAFVTANKALEFWDRPPFVERVRKLAAHLRRELSALRSGCAQWITDVRGRGLIYGIELANAPLAGALVRELFNSGVIAEVAGPRRDTLKILPSLLIEEAVLSEAVDRIGECLQRIARVNLS